MQEKLERMGIYEGMYIIDSSLSEELRKHTIEEIKGNIAKNGGKILVTHEWGRKKLEYKFKRVGQAGHHNDGYYYILFFEAPTLSIRTLWQEYRLNERLVRYMTMRVEKAQESLEFKALKEEV